MPERIHEAQNQVNYYNQNGKCKVRWILRIKCTNKRVVKRNSQKNYPAEAPATADIKNSENKVYRGSQNRIRKLFKYSLRRGLIAGSAILENMTVIINGNAVFVYMYMCVVSDAVYMDSREVNIDLVSFF